MKKKIKLSKRQKERLVKEFGHIPTKEEIFAKLEASLSRMTEALQGAWETMPEDPKIREQMTKVVAKSARLRHGIYQKIIKKDPSHRRPTPSKANA